MQKSPEKLPPYVESCDDSDLRVVCGQEVLEGVLFSLFRVDGEGFVTSTQNDSDKAHLLMALRDAGFAFSGGREWCPVEVLEDLREQGLVTGGFREIFWRGPGVWAIREHP